MFKKITALSLSLLGLFLTGCSSEPEWVALYDQCREAAQVELDKSSLADTASRGENHKKLIESMDNMVINMAAESCELIRASCEEDANSAACRTYVEQVRPR